MATWVYAITRGPAPERVRGVRGVGGEPVRAIERAGLSAVVGSVDPRRFGAEQPRGGLDDIRALEGLLRAHHQVVQLLAGGGTVLPLRLGTVYRGDERVAALLEERRAEFEAALARIAGRTEWGVKLFAEPAGFDGPRRPTPVPRQPGGSGGSGTRYLLRRKAEERSRERRRELAAALADRVHAALDAVAAASRRYPPQDARLSGDDGWMLLNGAYLVDRGRDGELAEVVRRFDDPGRGVRLELTGAWAPYSFADEEEGA